MSKKKMTVKAAARINSAGSKKIGTISKKSFAARASKAAAKNSKK